MTRSAVPFAVLAALGVLAAAGWGILAFLGTGPEAVRGLGLGYLLGIGGGAAEIAVMRRALERPLQQALRVVMTGFGIRLLVLFAGAVLLMATRLADPSAFALSFLAGFLAYLPVLGALTASRRRNGEARP
jgi:hypothetical protein